jgi:hypothetical protein
METAHGTILVPQVLKDCRYFKVYTEVLSCSQINIVDFGDEIN